VTLYTSSDAIAAYLGRTLTTDQQTQADLMAAAASDFIEGALGRSWLDTDGVTGEAVTDELHTVQANRIWLKHAPVDPDETVTLSVRCKLPGSTTYAQTEPYQWELLDASLGHIYTSPTLEGQLALVSYTSLEQIPPIIAQFATELAAGMLSLSLAGAAASSAALTGVRRYTLWGGDLSVEYAASATGQDGSAPGTTRLPALWSQIEALFSRKVSVA
jgi:hypothetical protein